MHLQIIGHRGSVINGEENTMSAFSAAYNSGLKWIETDLRLTSDNQIVLWHDACYAGVCISDATYHELKELSSGKLVSADNFLRVYAGKLKFDFDIKDAGVFKFISALISRYSLKDDLLITSFNHLALADFAKENPELECAPIIASRPCSVSSFINNIPFRFSKIIADADFCDKLMTNEFHRENISVWLYNINTVHQAEITIKHGISGIFINNPYDFKIFLAHKN
jgi:glycerophosphoryl diester phosphodiesterase